MRISATRSTRSTRLQSRPKSRYSPLGLEHHRPLQLCLALSLQLCLRVCAWQPSSQVSVLALSEAMLAAEAEEAVRERGGAEEALKRHRSEQREAEAEYQRVQVRGSCRDRATRQTVFSPMECSLHAQISLCISGYGVTPSPLRHVLSYTHSTIRALSHLSA